MTVDTKLQPTYNAKTCQLNHVHQTYSLPLAKNLTNNN